MAGLRDICGSAIKQRDLEAVYCCVDEDGGGEVEFIEFVAAMNQAAPPIFSNAEAALKAANADAVKIPYAEKLEQYEDSDSDEEKSEEKPSLREADDGEENTGGNENVGEGKSKERQKSLHEMLHPDEEVEEIGTAKFPGGRNLIPSERVSALILSLGNLTLASFRRTMDTKGRLTAGRMNGTLATNDLLNSGVKGAAASDETRILRKRDGTMCDFSAPLLMKRRAASHVEYRPELADAWKALRQVRRVDDWRGFHAPCVFMGKILQGHEYGYRVTVRNPLPIAITLEVEIVRMPGVEVVFSRKPIVSGLSSTIALTARMEQDGEYVGVMHIRWRVFQTEVLARKMHASNMVEDEDYGTCSVAMYAECIGPRKVSGRAAAGSVCPAESFELACGNLRCPKYALAADHPVHRYEIPSLSGDWHSRHPRRATSGRDGHSSATWRRRPTRKKTGPAPPRIGSARMQGRQFPTGPMDELSYSSLESTVSLTLEERAERRGILEFQYRQRKEKQSTLQRGKK